MKKASSIQRLLTKPLQQGLVSRHLIQLRASLNQLSPSRIGTVHFEHMRIDIIVYCFIWLSSQSPSAERSNIWESQCNWIKILRFRLDVVFGNGVLWLLPTAREGNVFTGVCHSVHNRLHGYSVTAHPCYSAVGTHPTGMLSCCNWFHLSIRHQRVVSCLCQFYNVIRILFFINPDLH